jgi:4-aminobutyrate aminotransferase
MDGVIHAPFPDTYRPLLARRAGEGYGETVVRYIEEEIMGRVMPADEIAGIVIEPIQGEGGYIIPPPEFFPALRELCDKHGILLIADEVQAGMGRTGKWWSIENFGVEPDIVTSAKGIASGVPLGAMIARKSVMTWTVGTHGNTYGGNPLACAAACETIDLIGESFMQNAAKVGEYALDALEEIAAHHPSIGDVRGKGLMIGVDFVKDQETREPASAFRDRVSDLAFERGVITLGCGESTIRVSPPLNITKAEIDEGLRAFDEAIGIAEKE